MPGSNDIKAGGAYVEVGAKDKNLFDKMKAAEARVKAFGAGIMSVGRQVALAGIAFITPFVLMANSFADAGARLEQLSAKTGISVEALSSLEFAARATGLTLEQIADAAKGTTQFLQAAAAGSDDTRQALRSLGITLQQLNSANPEERFRLLADRIARIPDPTRRAALAMRVFGEAGLQLLPLLNQGADGIARLEDRARELGLVMSGTDARAATELRTAIQTLWQLVARLGQVIGAAVTPTLMEFLGVINGLVSGAVRWIDQNREIVALLFRMGIGLVAAGAAILAFRGAVFGLQAAIFALRMVLIATAVVIGIFQALIYLGNLSINLYAAGAGIATAATTAFNVALAAANVLLAWLPAALLAGVAAFIYFSGTGRNSIQDVRTGFGQLYETATSTWQGIVDAISAGNLQLAFTVTISGLRLLWTQLVAYLQTRWLEYTHETSNAFSEASTEIGRIAIRGGAWIVDAAVNSAKWFMDVWINTSSLLQTLFSRLGTFVEGIWARVIALISGGDVEQALADISARGTEAERQIEQNRQSRLAINAEAGRQLNQRVGEARDGIIGQLDAMQNERIRASQAEVARRRAAINAPVAEAQREFDAAILDAWIASEDAAMRRLNGGPNQVDPNPTGGKTATVGTFSAEVAAGLGGNAPAERTAIATETTAQNTRRILDEVRNTGFAWG